MPGFRAITIAGKAFWLAASLLACGLAHAQSQTLSVAA